MADILHIMGRFLGEQTRLGIGEIQPALTDFIGHGDHPGARGHGEGGFVPKMHHAFRNKGDAHIIIDLHGHGFRIAYIIGPTGHGGGMGIKPPHDLGHGIFLPLGNQRQGTQLLHGELLIFRQPGACIHKGVHGLFQQELGVEEIVGVVFVGNGKGGPAPAQGLQGFPGGFPQLHHLALRKAFIVEDPGFIGKITGLGGIGDAAGGGTADGGHIIGQLVQLPQDHGGVPVEKRSGIGEHQPPPLPPKQLHPKLLLKTLIAQGQRRLGHMKPLCRLGDGVAFRNGNHIFQLQ